MMLRPSAGGRTAKPPMRAASTRPEGSNDDRQPLRRAGDAGIEPAVAAVGKREGFVEQHHVVPLRALRLVDGEHVAEIELVVALALQPFDLLDGAGEAFRPYRHL